MAFVKATVSAPAIGSDPSIAVTYTVGHAGLVWFNYAHAPYGTVTVDDDQGNTYTELGGSPAASPQVDGSGFDTLHAFVCGDMRGYGSAIITVHLGGSAEIALGVAEFDQVDPVTPVLDQIGNKNLASGDLDSGNFASGGGSGDVVVGVGSNFYNTVTWSPGTSGNPSGFAVEASATKHNGDGHGNIGLGWAALSGTYSGNVSLNSGTTQYGGIIALVLKAGSGGAPGTPAQLTWALQSTPATRPGYNGFTQPVWDPVAQAMLHYGILLASTSIYSSDFWWYFPATNTWLLVAGLGNGSLSNTCTGDHQDPPGDRHPVAMMAIDTVLNRAYVFSGVCSGTIHEDMYYVELNSDASLNGPWVEVTLGASNPFSDAGVLAFDPVNRVFVFYGDSASGKTWVFGPTTGSLTAEQSAAGCVNPNEWAEVTVVGGVHPSAVISPSMSYCSALACMLLWHGATSGEVEVAETWTYDVPTKTWTQVALGGGPPAYMGPSLTSFGTAFSVGRQKLFFHQPAGTGGPADWMYDPLTDVWTQLTVGGIGPTVPTVMIVDESTGNLVAFVQGGGNAEIWIGTLALGKRFFLVPS